MLMFPDGLAGHVNYPAVERDHRQHTAANRILHHQELIRSCAVSPQNPRAVLSYPRRVPRLMAQAVPATPIPHMS
jgi:hypothetical protein